MEYLAVTLPGGEYISPSSVPTGGLSFLATLLKGAITIFMMVGLMFVAIYMIWGAVQWISSGGDKAKLDAGRKRITWAVIGFILLMLSYFVISAVGYLFKVPGLLTF